MTPKFGRRTFIFVRCKKNNPTRAPAASDAGAHLIIFVVVKAEARVQRTQASKENNKESFGY